MNKVHEVFAYICVSDAKKAVEFYKEAFGATEKFRLTEPGSGRVGHVEIELGGTTIMMSDQFPEANILAPGDITGSRPFTIHLHVDNADEMIAKAVSLGATIEREPKDEFYGERGGAIRCPWGHRWLIGHSIESVTPEEMQRRWNAMIEAT